MEQQQQDGQDSDSDGNRVMMLGGGRRPSEGFQERRGRYENYQHRYIEMQYKYTCL